MTKSEILKKIEALKKQLGQSKRSVKTQFAHGSKNELGYGWGGNFSYTYKFDGRNVSLPELNSLVKKNCKAVWKDGMNRNGFYPIRKLASANKGKAIMKIGSHKIEAIA